MVGGRADRPAARELDLEDRTATDGPDLVARRGHDTATLVDRADLRHPADKLLDRHPPSIGKADDRVAGHAFAKRREFRFVAAVARGARELRESDDRHIELAGERLQVARDRGELLDAVLLVLPGANELEIVDDDDPEPAGRLGDRAACLRPQLHERGARRAVEEA